MKEIPQPSESTQPRSEIILRENDLNFVMHSNGFMHDGRNWDYDELDLYWKAEDLRGLGVSMFGPTHYTPAFMHLDRARPSSYELALCQQPVLDVMSKYRRRNEQQAGRIAYVLGGVVRHMSAQQLDQREINRTVGFIAKMTKLGEPKSGDAIASAMAMYVLSGGSTEENKDFEGKIYLMSEAIKEDPIIPSETADLGLSQVRRLRSFVDMLRKNDRRPFPDIDKDIKTFTDFPTVGAEFHLTPDASSKYPHFWQRLALLNISQFQLGNYVQFSRNDKGVIEVRMNPSYYPITIANWKHMRFILPELSHAYSTATFNRDGEDFDWEDPSNRVLLRELIALGLLSYTAVFDEIPIQSKRAQISYGDYYLGQTVKVEQGDFKFTGDWSGGKGRHGQLAIYAGFGDNLPYITYYASMALQNKRILNSVIGSLFGIDTIYDALVMPPEERKKIFERVQEQIDEDGELSAASEAGVRIIQTLTP